jgi:hypothetical protein
VIEGVPQDVGEGEDGMAIDDTLMEVVTEVADKVIDIDLGTSQA